MVDIVDIGYKVRAEGLEKANRDLNALLDKADKINSTTININTNGKSGTNGGNNSPSKEIDRTTKAMEKQRLVGDLLAQGLDKSTANTIASFKMLGATIEQTTQHQKQLQSNSAYVTQTKELEKLTKQQEKSRQIALDTQKQYQSLSQQSLGGGVLDQVEKQNKALTDMRKHYTSLESAQEKQQNQLQKVVNGYEKISSKSLGGGILDQVDRQNKGLQDLNKYYSGIEASQEKQLSISKKHNEQLEKTLTISQKTANYRQEGFTATNAKQLTSYEMRGANPQQMEDYRKTLISAQGGLQQFGEVSENTAKKVGFLNTEIGGIAKYAVLSAVIYGLMTATTRLAVATVQLADEYTAIQNRMKLYIDDAKTLRDVNQRLVKMSMENNVGLKETATLYARLAPSMQKMGASTQAITTVVDAFGKAMRIGGATAMEASSATIQFSQAMASGKLAGDEFRSISEASPRFLKAIAEGANIATEDLKRMSSEGALTTERIAQALIKEYPKLIEENKRLGVTLEQGANSVKTAFTMAIGEFNEGARITESVGNSLMSLATGFANFATEARKSGTDMKQWYDDHVSRLGLILDVVKSVTVAFVAFKVAGVASMVATSASTGLLTGMLIRATQAMTALNVAMTANPIGLVVKVLGGLAVGVGAFALMRKNAEEANKEVARNGELISKSTEELKKLKGIEASSAKNDLTTQLKEQNSELTRLEKQLKTQITTMKVSNAGMFERYEVIQALDKGTISLTEAVDRMNKSAVLDSNQIKTARETVSSYDKQLAKAKETTEQQKVLGEVGQLAGSKMQNALKRSTDEAKKLNGELLKATSGFEGLIKQAKVDTKISEISYNLKKGLMKGFDDSDIKAVATELYNGRTKYYNAVTGALTVDKKLIEQLAKKSNANTLLDSLDPKKKSKEDKSQEKSKEDKSQEKSIENFQDMVEAVERLNELMDKGASYDVAKVASQKEYFKVFQDTAQAIRIVQAQQLQAQLDYAGSLEKANDMNGRTLAWIREGLSLEQARSVAGAYYMTEVNGREVAERMILNTMNAQRTELFASSEELQNLNTYLEAGYNLADAQFAVQTNRLEQLRKERGLQAGNTEIVFEAMRAEKERDDVLKATNESIVRGQELERQKQIYIDAQNTAYDKLIGKMAIANKMASNPNLTEDQAKKEVQKDAELNAQRDLLSIRAQTIQNLNTQSKLIKDIESQYPLLEQGEVKRLAVAKQVLNISERIAEEQERQAKSPIGDFSGIDFDVFGSFGNPFQEALDGLNEFTAKSLESASVLKALDEQINAEKAKGIESEILKNLELEKSAVIIQQEVDRKKVLNASVTKGLALAKTAFKEDSKGYKTVTALERTYQAIQVAHSLWKKKDQLAETARELMGYAKTAIAYVSSTATKIASEGALNTVKGVGAVIQQGTGGDVYSAIPRMLAMVGVIAGLGVAISGGFGSSESGSIVPSNEGTGTVFGDPTAMSKSISKSIDILADNSDLMLPINNSMLASLRNIESALGGVANLILRREYGADIASQYGFDAMLTGTVGKIHDFASKSAAFFTGFTDKLTGFGVGELLSGLVGSVLGGLFGKTSQEVTGSGITGWAQSLGDILNNGFALNSYADIKTTKKSWFSKKTSYSTAYGAVDGEIKNQFQLIFSNVYDSILSASSVLDRDMDEVAKKLNASIINIGKIATSGLSGEDIQEKLEAVIGQQSDNIAKGAVGGLDKFQKVGEGYYETLVRVASGIEQADYFLDRLGYDAVKYTEILYHQGNVAVELIRQSVLLNEHTKDIEGAFYDLVNTFDGSAEELHSFIVELRDLQEQLEMTGKNADYLTSSMILGAGSLNALQQGFDAYYDMLSPVEQASELTRRLTKDFEFLSLQLPDDVKAFRDLINSIDITTESGQKLYGQVIALAPEFNELQDALESANNETNKLVESLRNLADEAKKARGETDQSRNLEATRYAFEQTSVLAMQGDEDAINKLLDLGKNLMSLSKTYSVTSAEYARDLALIQRTATISADNLEAGLGVSNNNLSLSGTTNTAPTLETTSSKTDEKLEAMNENLNSAMIAVAKNTQQIATLLDRWDYGDRLNVHIEQDGVNDRVPVKTD